jgi:heme oxygenase
LLEAIAMSMGLMNDFPEIRRKMRIETDYLELWKDKESTPPIVPSTYEYIAHIKDIMTDPDKIMAHIYVLHMGDLSGGQMIKRKVPGQGLMYEFDGDVKSIKEKIRSKTDDSMAEEAKWMFDSATKLFKDLMEIDCEHYLEQVN